ncbi:TetR/AcrR family transcriptional regulator [Dyadobacter sp. Leaf189]|uniref:TetR/AcrR family transcriptional regulator n=1 Tax=Dyadobacter sp. Leaf189 TaxID=1736295 RepID=UPI0006F65415|nr:TetR/AcrR family transcriptional regulator [Dyadobacter sp. Leaf189]KQS31135.1 TetR family transcriptional regulator [Dyadobacter sp. Leaf189]
MKCVSEKSEDKIREAAKRVFLKKGFDGTTSRDIAKEADMNIALTNYYFRSKEKLFMEIFKDLMEMYFQNIIHILNKPIDIKTKISEVVENNYRMMRQEPDLVIFIMNEIHKEPERLLVKLSLYSQLKSTLFNQQLAEGIESGVLRPVPMESILPLMTSCIEFLFLGKEMHQKVFGISAEEFEAFAENHKEHVKAMICNYLILEK